MKRYIRILIPIIIFGVMISTVSFANNEIADETINYNEWSSLSNENKEKVITPRIYSIPYTNEENANNSIKSKMASSPVLPTSYKTTGLTVRNQASTPSCWAYTLTSVISANIMKTQNKTYSSVLLSPRHMEYMTADQQYDSSTKTTMPFNTNGYHRYTNSGGTFEVGLGYITSGQGPVLETAVPSLNNTNIESLSNMQGKAIATEIKEYTAIPTISKDVTYTDTTNSTIASVKYTNGYTSSSSLYKEYTDSEVTAIRNKIKTQILNYGAVTTYTQIDQDNYNKYFNSDKASSVGWAYYNPSEATMDHAVTIIGWDDNYSKDNFSDNYVKPIHNGAYIVMGSYGTYNYNNGYYYISYDDYWVEDTAYGIVTTSDIDYDNIYQYDNYGPSVVANSIANSVYLANVFSKETIKNEKLNQISFYTLTSQDVKIYTNMQGDSFDKLTEVKDLGILTPGYYTYKFDSPQVVEGNKFIVAIKLTASNGDAYYPIENPYVNSLWSNATAESGESYISTNEAKSWTDLTSLYTNTNVCIKAFTVDEDIPSDITFTYSPTSWTNGSVNVTAATTETDYIIQTSLDNENWSNDQSRTLTSNGNVYARLATNNGCTGNVVTQSINNIDKTSPIINEVTESSKTSVIIKATDNDSGIVGYAITETNSKPSSFTSIDVTNSLDQKVSNIVNDKIYYLWIKDQTGNISDSYIFKIDEYGEVNKNPQIMPDGTYVIKTKTNENSSLDVSAASTENGGNIQIWNYVNVAQQKFTVEYLQDGYYQITSLNSGKVLDVQGAGKANGTNVQQYESNGTDAQKWIIKDVGDGYYSIISKCNDLYLNVANEAGNDGTNVEVYNENDSNTQKFKFICLEEMNGSETLKNGVYVIKTKLNENSSLDVSAASTENGGNIQIWNYVNVAQQKFIITYLGEGYYKIESLNSGKVLDVQGAGKTNGINVQQYESNGTDAQKWIIKDVGDGYYSIISKCNDLYVDVTGGSSQNGTNVQLYAGNDSDIQKFKMELLQELQCAQIIPDGTYAIKTALNETSSLDVSAASKDNCANVQLWDYVNVAQQKFILKYINDDYQRCYQITSVNSGKSLDVQGAGRQNGTNVQQYESNGTDAQRWIIQANSDGYNIISKCNGLFLDVSCGNPNNGSNIQVYEKNGTIAQKFKLVKLD